MAKVAKEVTALQIAQVQTLLANAAVIVGKGEDWPEGVDVAERNDTYYVSKVYANEHIEFFKPIEDLMLKVNAQFGEKRKSVYSLEKDELNRQYKLLESAEKAVMRHKVAGDTNKRLLAKQNKEIAAKEVMAFNVEEALRLACEQMRNDPMEAPIIKMVRPAKGGDAVPMLLLSDLHLEATVEASQVNNLNEFNLEIAKARYFKVFENFAKTMFSNKDCGDDLVVIALGGDLFEGYIHDECRINGSVTIGQIMKLFVEWTYPQLLALSKIFKNVYVPAVVGNHGRMDQGYIMQDKAYENFEWLALNMLKAKCDHLKNVTIDISSATDAVFSVNGHRFLMTHGDQCKSAGGVGGIYPSLLKLHYRKTERAAAMGLAYDTMILGHFHQYHDAHDIVVNGSLKGYDNYAFESNFKYEPPRQAAWLVHAKYGRVARTPIYCEDDVRFLNRGATSKKLFVSEMVNADLETEKDEIEVDFSQHLAAR